MKQYTDRPWNEINMYTRLQRIPWYTIAHIHFFRFDHTKC